MNTKKRKRNYFLNNFSIRKRLPILITFLLLLVIIIFSLASFNNLKKISLEGGKERLNALVTEFSSLFQQSTNVFLNTVESAANSNSIKTYIKSNGTKDKTDAAEELNILSSKVDTLSLMVELRDADKNRVLTSTFIKKNIEPDAEFLNKYLIPGKPTISKFYILEKHIYWAATAPVMKDEKTIGYITKWRLVLASPGVIKQLSKLLGSNALLYIGNSNGNLWYNLSDIIPNPPVNMRGKQGIVEYSRMKGSPLIAQTKEIPGTEWMVLIELSKNKILYPSQEFLGNMLLIGLILILGGILLAIMMSRSITKPLNLLTRASSNIASGDYSSFVNIKQNDELGKLASSFNFMLTKVNESQKNLQSSLKEKEVLLKEIHHRVKNNLQIISSLLNLQTSFLKEEESIQAIESSRNRIRSMAIVHEKLYQTENFVQINFKDYVHELVKNLANSYKSENDVIYKIEVETTFVNIDLATSLGLIITELISNSVKHAFIVNNGSKNEIVLGGNLINDNCYKLIFKDNGIGLPKDFDINSSESLGLQLVTSLVEQINGTITAENISGTQYEITFNLNNKNITSKEPVNLKENWSI